MSEIFDATGPMHRALGYHLERQNLIASNIANAETPGFRPRELVRTPPVEEGGRLPMTRTIGAHLRADGSRPGEWETIEDTTHRPGNDGNAVNLEREMSRMAANNLRYDGVSNTLTRHIAMLRYAANDGNG
ncbi:MAG: flagellar basal body rod protein FlgB [Myxococcota bacterium]